MWYIPAYISNYNEEIDPQPEDIILFTLTNPGTDKEFIPVYNNPEECNDYIKELNSLGKKDKAICIYAFQSLAELEKRIRNDFGRPILLIMHETEKKEKDTVQQVCDMISNGEIDLE